MMQTESGTEAFLLDPCQFSEAAAYRQLIADALKENFAYQQFWVNSTTDGRGCHNLRRREDIFTYF